MPGKNRDRRGNGAGSQGGRPPHECRSAPGPWPGNARATGRSARASGTLAKPAGYPARPVSAYRSATRSGTASTSRPARCLPRHARRSAARAVNSDQTRFKLWFQMMPPVLADGERIDTGAAGDRLAQRRQQHDVAAEHRHQAGRRHHRCRLIGRTDPTDQADNLPLPPARLPRAASPQSGSASASRSTRSARH